MLETVHFLSIHHLIVFFCLLCFILLPLLPMDNFTIFIKNTFFLSRSWKTFFSGAFFLKNSTFFSIRKVDDIQLFMLKRSEKIAIGQRAKEADDRANAEMQIYSLRFFLFTHTRHENCY